MLAEDIVLQSSTAAFSRGPGGVITAWNGAAEGLFAMPAADVVGKSCHRVLAGRDVFGNDYCGEVCASWRMVLEERPVHPYRLASRDAFGRSVELRVSILATQGRSGPGLVHLMEPTATSVIFATLPHDLEHTSSSASSESEGLTRRELEVLRLLSFGWCTDDIAVGLMISPATVRYHISRCLQKLEVHSRLEAVSIARRLEIV